MTGFQKKYDRQIRTFGFSTQQRIQNTSLILYTETENYISAEVIKNFVLLGINELRINKKAEASLGELLPDSVTDVNEGLCFRVYDTIDSLRLELKQSMLNGKEGVVLDKLKVSDGERPAPDDSTGQKGSVDETERTDCPTEELRNLDETGKIQILIVIDCFFELNADFTFYICSKCYSFSDTYSHTCNTKEQSIENDCLLGAISVQEIIKMFSNENYRRQYQIDV